MTNDRLRDSALWHQDFPKQFNFQARLDSLMICARYVSRPDIIAEGVIDLENSLRTHER